MKKRRFQSISRNESFIRFLTRCAAATNEITNGTSNATTTTSNSKMTSRSTPTTAQSSPKGMHQRGKKIALLASKPLQKNTANFFQFEILVLFDTLCTIVHYSCATNYSTMQNTSMIFNYRSRILIIFTRFGLLLGKS